MTGTSDGVTGPDPAESNLGLVVRARRGRAGHVAVALMIVAGVAGAVVASNLDPTVPAGGPAAARQAAAIDALLTSSAAGRDHLLSGIEDINACTADSHTVDATTVFSIRAAIRARADLAARIDTIEVADLPNGVRIKEHLQQAVQASYLADKAYLDWVLAAGKNCPTHDDTPWPAVEAANDAARAAKRTLLDDWNPVAATYGLPRRSATII